VISYWYHPIQDIAEAIQDTPGPFKILETAFKILPIGFKILIAIIHDIALHDTV
jgi:hypothetical protein